MLKNKHLTLRQSNLCSDSCPSKIFRRRWICMFSTCAKVVVGKYELGLQRPFNSVHIQISICLISPIRNKSNRSISSVCLVSRSAPTINSTKWWLYFNCHEECMDAGIKSGNLFLCDKRKAIKMLRTSGSLTSPLCVKITLSCLLFMLLYNVSGGTRAALQVQRQTNGLHLFSYLF